jgi:ferrous iron transport protein B
MANLTVALVGNPNCGKTTLFNILTGARQQVGNWSGVTVERKTGRYLDKGERVEVIDLPGVYSLSVVPGVDSVDEAVGRDTILSGEAQVVVDVVDVTNLERNLYLTAQLLEMRKPLVLALNMMDTAARRGIEVDIAGLRARLGVPVVPLVACKGQGIAELKNAIREAAEGNLAPILSVPYGPEIESAVAELRPRVEGIARARRVDPRWLAVKLLEGDDLACRIAGAEECGESRRVAEGIRAEADEDPDTLIADGRYGFVNQLTHAVLTRRGLATRTRSDAIDRIVLNRWLGLPIFMAVMYLLFMATINLGGAFVDFFDQTAEALFVKGLGTLLESAGVPTWVKVLLADGVGGGIQVVGTFIPIIGFLYLFLSFLEDSGYMARAAFLMDRFMRLIGLPGKAFVPLIVGFGCNVPAVMATRSLDKERDRVMATLMTPFMSCGARLAVYALFAAAFFPQGGQNLVFALYLTGIAVAILTGLALKHTVLKGETSPFVMELPSYHLPPLRSLLVHAWARLKSFVTGAGQAIVAVVVVLSFLNSLGTDGSFGNENSGKSVLAGVGKAIVPVFRPMGIQDDNWPATVGIFTGIFAKEAVVGTLDALYSGLAEGEGESKPEEPFDLAASLARAAATVPEGLAGLADLLADPLGLGVIEEGQEVASATFGAMAARFDGKIGAFAYLLLILLYIPCVATLGAINRELGARWTLFAAAWTMGVAYVTSVGFYQTATFAAHPAVSLSWIGGLLGLLAAALLGLHLAGRRRPRQGLAEAP